jgi:DNA excision repair protein ERCC-2
VSALRRDPVLPRQIAESVVVSAEGPRFRISVRDLADRVWRRGDLHLQYERATAAIEGQRSQQRAQQGLPESYQAERSLSYVHHPEELQARAFGLSLEVKGRLDGCDLAQRPYLVEEYKTSRQDPAQLHQHLASVHWAQLRCYVGMLVAGAEADSDDASADTQALRQGEWCLRLVYLHPDHSERHIEEDWGGGEQWLQFLHESCERYLAWVARLLTHRQERDKALQRLAFPLEDFRPPQRILARQVYQHIRQGQSLLVEAPTGIGKTLGTLYPSLRSLGEGDADRIIFLTARNTGAAAVMAAREQFGKAATPLRTLAVTARDRICFLDEPRCDPESCPYARGYFDRMPAARDALLAENVMDASTIRAIAETHQVCPFELSLDAVPAADLIVADYNYAFDPVVRLQRLPGYLSERNVLLIDEAHQLHDRVCGMWSGVLSREILRQLAALPGAVGREARGLDRLLLTLRREVVGTGPAIRKPYEQPITLPVTLADRLARLQSACADLRLQQPDQLPSELWFEVIAWARLCDWYEPENYLALLSGQGTGLELQFRCLQPAPRIAEVLASMHAAISFSGTLSPLKWFHAQFGQGDASTLRLDSIFEPTQLAVTVIKDIDVRYRQRDRSLPRLAQLVTDLIESMPGRYLVVLPSFAYLQQLSALLAADLRETALLCQGPDMSQDARANFLAQLQADGASPLVACVVLGGIFAESIDLPAGSLQGMVVVGIGLPPPSLERAVRQQRVEAEHPGLGVVAAYEQPAMTRVVQAAGRLIRRETDRAVLCLVDDRFQQAALQRYFPDFWQPKVMPADQLRATLDAFWNTG